MHQVKNIKNTPSSAHKSFVKNVVNYMVLKYGTAMINIAKSYGNASTNIRKKAISVRLLILMKND